MVTKRHTRIYINSHNYTLKQKKAVYLRNKGIHRQTKWHTDIHYYMFYEDTHLVDERKVRFISFIGDDCVHVWFFQLEGENKAQMQSNILWPACLKSQQLSSSPHCAILIAPVTEGHAHMDIAWQIPFKFYGSDGNKKWTCIQWKTIYIVFSFFLLILSMTLKMGHGLWKVCSAKPQSSYNNQKLFDSLKDKSKVRGDFWHDFH